MISKTLNLQLEMFKRFEHICFYPLTTQIYNHMLNSMVQTKGACQFGLICQVNIPVIEIMPALKSLREQVMNPNQAWEKKPEVGKQVTVQFLS